MITAASSSAASLRRLNWDTAHFGIPVAEIAAPDLTNDELRTALTTARADGLQLVYWATHRHRELPTDLLHEFQGLAVNHRVKFAASLDLIGQRRSNLSCGDTVREFPRGPATRELLDLAVVAGGHSRFQVDPRIPDVQFRQLYETWMKRSTMQELADVVMVAVPQGCADEIVGTITLSETAGAGQIGLLAVREDHRGKGVATRLMTAAHEWLRQRGASELNVVTQLENREACGLHSRWNCEVVEVRLWFHFWPQITGAGG
jgi:GNAT superfamily N-acetyltransferase